MDCHATDMTLSHPSTTTTSYVATQPGSLRIFIESLRADLETAAAVTSLEFSLEYDSMATSGVIEFAEEVRQEYEISASGDDVSLRHSVLSIETDVKQSEDDEATEAASEILGETEEGETTEENVLVCTDSPSTSASDAAAVATCTPFVPVPDASDLPFTASSPPFDHFRQTVEDFEASKMAAGVDSDDKVPESLYLGLLVAFLSICVNVTKVVMPGEWKILIGEKVKSTWPKVDEVEWLEVEEKEEGWSQS